MRRRRSKCVEAVALAIGLVCLEKEGTARAQACCVAPSTSGLGRLANYESMLAGVEARGAAMYGSFAPDGRLSAKRSSTHDVALEQNLFATMRFLSRGQGTVTVPFVQTFRGAGGASAAGGGIGDVRGSVRWDLVYSEHARPLPGVAVIAGGSAPTGTPPERATTALATDATGIGTMQGWAGLALEETTGPWLFVVNGLVSVRADRRIGDATASLPPRISTGLAAAYAWHSGFVVSAGASYAFEGDASLDGTRLPNTSRRALQTMVAFQAPLPGDMRLVSAVFATPPIPSITAGETATTGLSLALVVPWN